MRAFFILGAAIAAIWAVTLFTNEGSSVIPIAKGDATKCFDKHKLLVASGMMDFSTRCLNGEFKNERQAKAEKERIWLNADTMAFKPMDELEEATIGKGKWTKELDAEMTKRWAKDLDPSLE